LTSNDQTRIQLIKKKFKLQYLHDYSDICYILGIIDKDMYMNISEFNKKRNKVIHELLKKSISPEGLRNIAREGRKIQMILSPLNHSKEDIKRIIQYFDEITK